MMDQSLLIIETSCHRDCSDKHGKSQEIVTDIFTQATQQ